MEAKGRMMLKVVGILLIIFGAFGLLGSIILLFSGGVLGAVGAESGLDPSTTAAIGGLAIIAGLVALVISVIDLVAGILGVKNCAKPDKAQTCFIFGIIMIVIQIISDIIAIVMGSFNIITIIIGLVLPVLYTIGAVQNKQSA